MRLFENILVPVDFSACSKNALREAHLLCKQHGGKLTVLHVINIATTPSGDMTQAKDLVGERLEELLEDYRIEGDILVEKGLPAEVISSVLDEKDFSLCVMGTHQRHDIISEMVGTIALKVVQHANTPVLVIPGRVTLGKIDRIVFATDFKKIKDNYILSYLRDICLATEAELHLLNVNESPQAISQPEAEEALELHQYLFDINHAFFFSEDKDPVKGITRYIREKNIRLLVMMPRHHGFFETLFNDSVTDQIALHLEIPLFSFHE